jgi:eukaryotic-like serine/threonine-protein kinase
MQRIVLRCLEKDPEQRFQSAKDVGFALESVSVGTTQTESVAVPATRNGWRVAAATLAVCS